jgi:hypothetical protein
MGTSRCNSYLLSNCDGPACFGVAAQQGDATSVYSTTVQILLQTWAEVCSRKRKLRSAQMLLAYQ